MADKPEFAGLLRSGPGAAILLTTFVLTLCGT